MSLKNLRYWINRANDTNYKGPTQAAILMRDGDVHKDIDLSDGNTTRDLLASLDAEQVAATFCKATKGGWGGQARVPGLTGGTTTLYVTGKGDDLDSCVQEMTLKLVGHQSRIDILADDKVAQLELRLQQHDWHFAMSDDGRVAAGGEQSLGAIRRLIAVLDPEAARPLWDKYAPEGFQFPIPTVH